MPISEVTDRQPILVTVFWWVLTIVTLVVVDDLTFGPLFWFLARVGGLWAAVAAVFAVYVPGQLWLVWRATEANPGRVADWFLRRFDVHRRYEPVEQHALKIQSRVVGVSSSIMLAAIIGGVLPPLLLWRRGWPRVTVIRVALITSLVYTAEFAFLHAVIPASI